MTASSGGPAVGRDTSTTQGLRQEPYYCRVCGERVRQKGDSGLFVNVVKGKRILERWALCKEHNPRR